MYPQRMESAIRRAVIKEQGKLSLWMKTIELHSPERIFNMGYSLTMRNGKIVKSSRDIESGDTIETYLQDGTIHSVVK